MKKIWGVLIFLSIAACVFAQEPEAQAGKNYYALVEIVIKSDSGLSHIMSTITKTSSSEECAKILYPADKLKDKFVVRSGCFSGPEWEKRFGYYFANKPAASPYVAYTDPNGFATRVNTKAITGQNSPAPGTLIDLELKDAQAWAKAMLETLAAGGIKDAKVINPAKK